MTEPLERSDDRLLAGSADDFAVFYRRHLPIVLSFAFRRTHDREVAADVTAEVFAAALRSRLRFDPARGDARAWLCSIAAHKIIDSVRRGQVEDACRRALRMQAVLLTDDDLDRIDELVSTPETAAAAQQFLAALPATTRTAVLKRVINEEPYGTIAAELRCSEAVVRQRVSRGLRQLRTQMEERT